MKIEMNRENLLNVNVFLILYLSISFVVTNDVMPNFLTILLWILVLTITCTFSSSLFNKRITGIAILICAIISTSSLINGGIRSADIKTMVSFFIISVFVSTFDFKEFITSYIKIMKFICKFSLVTYTISVIFPQLYNLFPNFLKMTRGRSGSRQFLNLLFSVQWLNPGSSIPRNWGFAWEPGAFVTFVCLAMFLEMFHFKMAIKTKDIILYSVTIITTFSTTGIIALVMLLIYELIAFKQSDSILRKRIIGVSAVGLVILYPIREIFFDTKSSSAFGKLITFASYGDSRYSSTLVRINSVKYPFLIFLQNPFLGVSYRLGELDYEYTYGMNTCTFINWFAFYGLFFGVLMILGLLKFSKKISSGSAIIFSIIYFFVITLSENYATNAFILILVLYGFKDNHNNELK